MKYQNTNKMHNPKQNPKPSIFLFLLLILLSSDFIYSQNPGIIAGPDTVIMCPGDTVTLNITNPNLNVNYLWSTGKLGTSIKISQTGTYSVIADSGSAIGTPDVVTVKYNYTKSFNKTNLFNSAYNGGGGSASSLDVKMVDLNGDMLKDILIGGGSLAAWYQNFGDGNFSQQKIISFTDPRSIIADDIDKDGDMDIVSASSNRNKITWIENLGNGNFANAQTISSSTSGVNDVFSVDIDNDGDSDIVSANSQDHSITWFEHLGNGVIDTTKQVVSAIVNSPESVYAIDIDKDGDVDILSAGRVDQELYVHINQGNTTFTTMKMDSSSGTGPVSVHSEDFDGDGYPEVVFSNEETTKIFKNTNGQFGNPVIISQLSDDSDNLDLFTTDIDGDGDFDILSSRSGFRRLSSHFVWFENDGNGQFLNTHLIDINSNYGQTVHAGDIDLDGDIDVINGKIEFGTNIVDWDIYSNKIIGSPESLQTVTCRGDSAKLVYSTKFDSVKWFADSTLNNIIAVGDTFISGTLNKDTSFWLAEISSLCGYIQKPFKVDVNLLKPSFSILPSTDTVCRGSSVSVLPDRSNYSYQWSTGDTTNQITPLQSGTYDVTVTELIYGCTAVSSKNINLIANNNLPVLDNSDTSVICPNASVLLKVKSPRKDLSYQWNNSIIDTAINVNGPGLYSVASIDSNGCKSDSTSHIVQYNSSVPGPISFQSQEIIDSLSTSSVRIKHADIDGDGDNDILNAASDKYIQWFENLGDGTFGPSQMVSSANNGPFGIFPGDFDNDGDIDVLAASFFDDEIIWYPNQGNGNFGIGQLISSNVSLAYEVFAADLDNDGDLDALSASRNDNKVAWYENLGNGNFSQQKVISINANDVYDIYVADLNNDGFKDVLSASSNDDKIAWYENLGGSGFGVQQIITTNANGAWCVLSADLDGDSDPDVLSASGFDDKVAWYENLGGGVFGSQQVITTNGDAAIDIKAIDIDADNDLDLIVASQKDDKIAWYENLGGASFGAEQIINIPDPDGFSGPANGNADNVRSIIAVDLDGDTDIDVASASASDNKVAVYKNVSVQFKPVIRNDTVCLNSSAELVYSGVGSTTHWYADSTLTNFLGAGDTFRTHLLLSDTAYWAQAYDSICGFGKIGRSKKIKAIINTPEVAIGGSSNFCEGYETTIFALGWDNYLWSTGDTSNTIVVDSPGTYSVIVSDSAGTCTTSDSVQIMQIPSTYDSLIINACDSYTVPSGNQTYTSNGSQMVTDTISNKLGCDSIITIDLTINNSTSGTDVINACDSFTWIDGVTYTSSNNTATNTLTNAEGCDSIVTLDLTINNTNGTDLITACDSFTWIDGNTYTASNNTATFILTNVSGCDSVITLDLTIPELSPQITRNDSALSVVDSFFAYQWHIDGSAISGASSFQYEATQSGDYYVQVENAGGCTGTSDTVEVIFSSIENLKADQVRIYPNPFTQAFTVELPAGNSAHQLRLLNVQGKEVLRRENITQTTIQISHSALSSGLYLLEVQGEWGIQRKKLIRR